MANDNFDGIARKAVLRCPAVSLLLAYDLVRNSFRDIVEMRRWSWLLKRGQLVLPAVYKLGTATATKDSLTVQLNGTAVAAAAFVGLQFRMGSTLPIYTIVSVDIGLNQLTLDQLWEPSTQTAKPYQIYQAYVFMPSDFHTFITIIDPTNYQPVGSLSGISDFDLKDPQRLAAGPALGIAPFDYYLGVPRYEIWPHQTSATVFPFTYESRPIDPFDPGATVPSLLPSNVILERVMYYCALWPGESKISPNPYFVPSLAKMHNDEFKSLITAIKKQDNEVMQQNIWYQADQTVTSPFSASWMQGHDLL